MREALAPQGLDVLGRNARNLEIEVFWASLLSAATAFNAPFAIRLGATNAEIGLLSSIPALLALLVTIPSGQILNRRAQRMPLVIQSLFIHRLGFLLVALIPWVPIAQKGTVLVWLLIAFSIPAHFFSVGWNSMLADLIPETNRAQVFAIRNILAAAAVTSGTFLAGWWLERSVFPLNYQVVYVIGFTAALISIYYILKLRVPDSLVPPASPRQPVSFRSLWSGFQQVATHQPDFVRLVVNTLAHNIGPWMIGPLYILYYMRVLGATEGWVGLNGMLGNLAAAIGYYWWQRAIRRWGENRVLKWTISVIGLYPVLVGLSPSLRLILVWTALNNLIAPGVSLSHFNMFLKICPEAERPVYIGIYTTIMNVGAFVMPLLGVYLANRFGLAPMLVAGGVLCLAGSSLFRLWSLRTPDSLAARQS